MHDIIRENLEEYLQGRCREDRVSVIQAHLEQCRECGAMLEAMLETNSLLATLRAPEDSLAPAPGFYARVMDRIEERRRPSFWSFLLDPIFGKRLVYGSLAVVALMGAYMFTANPIEEEIAAAPEAILSQPSQPAVLATTADQDRDAILVNLATYRE